MADGIHSMSRQRLVPGSLPRYAGYTCWRGLVNNNILGINETSETWGAQEIAQTSNRLLALLRNTFLRMLPEGAHDKRFEQLYKTDF